MSDDENSQAATNDAFVWVSRLTVKKVLNHAERDVTAIYDRHSYDPEKRTALEAWARRLDVIVSGKPAKSQVAELSVAPQQATRG